MKSTCSAVYESSENLLQGSSDQGIMELTGALVSNLPIGSQTRFLEASLGIFFHRCVSILTLGSQDMEGPEGSCSLTLVSPGPSVPAPLLSPQEQLANIL